MDKRKSTTTVNKNRSSAIPNSTGPTIVGTRASMARAKAINAHLRSQSNSTSTARKRRREGVESSDQVLKRKTQELNQKPAWDLRGRIDDMTNLYELNMKTLAELKKFKQEFDIIKDEKETEEKRAFQQVASLKAELLEMDRQHERKIVEIKAAQRVEKQKIEDEEFNHSRRLHSMKVEAETLTEQLEREEEKVKTIQEKNHKLRQSIEKLENKVQNFTEEDKQLTEELEHLERVLEEKNKQISERTKILESKKKYMAEIDKKLTESNTDRERLRKKIAELEAKKRR
ncbi:hypothetical protein BDF20DRAFT_660043 [Mycotypha africana]|uniref:uncharacterized protein n=1 Tax=Mycotypha africana TaxID=64632 RepID=UPI0023009496|nr:uncharacterized protein BDF20DRAFT_660043 [Mycotypha africana]KAI8973578.1 hypothetical protein BDF20DRAFT_660043 [Mycotypha africana]